MSSPHLPSTLLPSEDLAELRSGDVRDERWLLQQDAGSEGGARPQERRLQRAQREALASPGAGWHLQQRRQGESGGKKKEALTSIAGGLQAVSREKGGFGFRFGRNRWSDWRRRSERQRQRDGAE